MLRSDQLYEERAIDVVPDYPSHQNYFKKSNDTVKSRGDKKHAPRSRPHSSGTVRSIPIKHYRASIAYNIGSLRRSEAPQLQFESSISEPEKGLQASRDKTASTNRIPLVENEPELRTQLPRLSRVSKSPKAANPSRRSCHSCDYQREIQTGGGKNNSKLKTLDRRIVRSEHNISIQEGEQDFSDFDDYFHKSSSRKPNSCRQKKPKEQCANVSVEDDDAKESKDEARAAKKWGTMDLERGHVGQKISAYEENARRSGRNWDSPDNYQIFSETKKHRAIGVPLVGMHNACGLPVVASWHDHELLEPIRIRSRVLGTLRPIFKGTRSSFDLHRRTHPKRKAPQPSQCTMSKKNRSVRSRRSDKADDHPTIRSLVSLGAGNGEVTKRRRRRSSFKARKIGTFSSKSSVKRSGKSDTKRNKENSVDGSTRWKSVDAEIAKRQTLYARDDGEDAVQVLKSLCLNPLARTKSETDMIW